MKRLPSLRAGMYHAQNQDDKTWGLFAHLSALLGNFVGIGHFIGPLVIYLLKKDTSPFVAQEAKEALNFQITFLLLAIAAIMAGLILMVTIIGIPIAIVLFVGVGVLAILNIILPIIAGIKANEGSPYRYPFALRLIQ